MSWICIIEGETDVIDSSAKIGAGNKGKTNRQFCFGEVCSGNNKCVKDQKNGNQKGQKKKKEKEQRKE